MPISAVRCLIVIAAVAFGWAVDVDWRDSRSDPGAFVHTISFAPSALADDDDDDDDDDDSPRRRPRPEYVVSVPLAADVDRLAGLGYTIIARDPLPVSNAEIARVRGPAGMTLTGMRAQLATQIPAAVIDFNHAYRPNELSCHADGCAAFDMVGWSRAPDCRLTPTIGMIDTRVDDAHPALRGRNVESLRVTMQDRRQSSSAHGTAVASLLVGDPQTAIPGLLPDARLIAVDAFHRDARGSDAADAFDLARALNALALRNVGTINMSFSGPANLVLRQSIEAVSQRGIGMTAAAGNSGPRAAPLYPAAYPGVVAVTAIDRQSRIYRQAGAGDHIAFSAPGVRLRIAAGGATGRLRSGTSYAVPFVTAAMALKREMSPGASVADLVQQLASSAVDLGAPGRDRTFGWGLVKFPDACTARSKG